MTKTEMVRACDAAGRSVSEVVEEVKRKYGERVSASLVNLVRWRGRRGVGSGLPEVVPLQPAGAEANGHVGNGCEGVLEAYQRAMLLSVRDLVKQSGGVREARQWLDVYEEVVG